MLKSKLPPKFREQRSVRFRIRVSAGEIALKKKWRIVLLLLLLVAVGGSILAFKKYNERGIVTVQTGKVSREDLTAIVTASGEVKPRNYINIGVLQAVCATSCLMGR